MSHNLGGMTQNRLGGMCPPDFKPPDQAAQHVTSAPSQPKKRRKTANANAAAALQTPATTQDLLPPPLSGYGDTIVASNPFDDTPSTPTISSGPQGGGGGNIGPPHPGGVNVSGPGNPMMNSMMHGMGPHGMPPPHPSHPMHMNHMGGPPIRGMHSMNPMNPMNPMMNHPMNAGGMNSRQGPGGGGGMNPNMGPGGPMPMPPGPGMNNNMGNMNMSSMGPMVSMPPHMAGAGGGPNPNAHMGMNSPNMTANGNRLGSPMGSSGTGSALGSPIGNNPHISNSPMGPPMHSPSLGNGPMHMPPTQPPGSRINVSNGSPLNANANQSAHGNVSPMMGNVPGPCNGPNLSHHPQQQNEQLHNAMGAPPQHPHMPQQSPLGNNVPVSGSGPDNTNLISNNIDMMGMNHQQNHHMNSMNALNGPGGMHPPNHQLNRMYGGPGPGPKPMSMGAGKIYPPNQPMVFNPQNPSAPPIYTCGSCHKEINDNEEEALFCESGCNFFFHR